MPERYRSEGPSDGASKPCSLVSGYQQWNTSNGVTTKVADSSTTSNTTAPGDRFFKEMNDIITPGFHSRMSRGEIINSPMDSYQYFCEVIPMSIISSVTYSNLTTREACIIEEGLIDPGFFDMRGGDGGVWPTEVPDASFSDLQIANLQRTLVSEAWARCANAPMNIWVIVGEFNESVRTVARVLQAIAFLFRLARKKLTKQDRALWNRRRKSGMFLTWRDVRKMTNFWLELRYGLRPLVYELFNALEALDRIGDKARQRFHASGEATTSASSAIVQKSLGASVTFNVQTTRLIVHEVRAGCLVQPVFSKENLLSLLGAGEAVKGSWDLIPYSFVIDWFTNVGDVISSWSPNAFVQPLASWCVSTITDTTTREVVQGSVGNPSSYNGWGLLGGGTLLTGGRVRSVVTTKERIPNPPRAVVPNLSIRLDAAKVVDLAALAFQFTKFK